MNELVKPARPFNQPVSLIGKATFAGICALERAVRRHSKVGIGPFFAEQQFPWVPAVKARWRDVHAEAVRLLAERERLPAFQDISTEVGYITQDRQWKTFMLVGYGLRSHGVSGTARRPRRYCDKFRACVQRSSRFSSRVSGFRRTVAPTTAF